MRLKLILFSLFLLMNSCHAADCDCSYHAGGCTIKSAAERGFKCKCLYKGFWTCGGAAFPCSDEEICPGGRSDYCACKLGRGDCGAYREEKNNLEINCQSANHVTNTPVIIQNADCDCSYHAGGCTIKSAAPQGYKCVCVYKGFWTCSGWAHGCRADEYCPGGLFSYCGCRQGEGDCEAYPEYDSDPSGNKCSFEEPKNLCDCNRSSDWTSSSYIVSDVAYDMSKVERSDIKPQAIGTKDIPNASDAEQSIWFTVTKSLTSSSSFTHTSGIQIGYGVSFTAGFPLLTHEFSTTISQGYTWGKSKDVTLTFTNRFTCNGPPKKQTRCDVTVQRATAKVPYTMTLTHKKIPNCKCTSKGIWSGLDAFDHRLIARTIGNCNRLQNNICVD